MLTRLPHRRRQVVSVHLVPTRGRRPAARSRAAAGLLAGVALTLLAGCQQPALTVNRLSHDPPVDLVGTPFDPAVKPKYVLYPGDRLLVRFPTDKELDQEVRIRSDGKISLPYVGDIEAAYRAPQELAAEINEKSKAVLTDPRAVVIVLEEVGRVIYINGQVQKPGILSLQPGQTLMQTVTAAGGATILANAEQVLVLRRVPDDATYVLSANLKQIVAGQAPDVRMEPFDLVHVPETIIAQVDLFVEQYVNALIPHAASFPFITQLHNEPLKIVSDHDTRTTIIPNANQAP
ncbi:MAG: polysaccharide biosynthesis/export family protein [Planctomycetes bacterium]|nr:polysaccharide biosynthesis/export family protein [Planctomycetota bacterium]